jgi:hypothetical protein
VLWFATPNSCEKEAFGKKAPQLPFQTSLLEAFLHTSNFKELNVAAKSFSLFLAGVQSPVAFSNQVTEPS